MHNKAEIINRLHNWEQVAHACNPSYSRGRETGGSQFKASSGKQFMKRYLKNNPTQKTGLAEWLK
jgi:hypothetical protein